LRRSRVGPGAHFDSVPRDVTRLLRETLDIPKLKWPNGVAATCADLAAFREALLS
jgi:hypothetical protein